jgi:hypothetical protein
MTETNERQCRGPKVNIGSQPIAFGTTDPNVILALSEPITAYVSGDNVNCPHAYRRTEIDPKGVFCRAVLVHKPQVKDNYCVQVQRPAHTHVIATANDPARIDAAVRVALARNLKRKNNHYS